MYILGINSGLTDKHDGAVALIKDVNLLMMIEEERFSRKKHAFNQPPIETTLYCLEHAGITLEDVSIIAIGFDEKLYAEIEGVEFENESFLNKLFPKEVFKYEQLPEICYVPHHLAHAGSTFWPSGFNEAAILIADGRGEKTSTSLGYGSADGIHFFKEYGAIDSLGDYYGFASEWSGLSFWGPGKFMGLAAYGKPTEETPLQNSRDDYFFERTGSVAENAKNQSRQLGATLLRSFHKNNFPFAKGDGQEPLSYSNFAASIQDSLENASLALLRKLKEETQSENLVIAGGVALNCSMNGRLAEEGIFKNIFFQPVAHDAGVSLGAALYVHKLKEKERGEVSPSSFQMSHAYWGPSYQNEEIEAACIMKEIKYTKMDHPELVQKVAKLLSQNKMVGWFQGRAEVGPRALGARSILGNPCHRENLIRINQIKKRELWRPLAPSVLEESFSDYFISEKPSEFMIVAAEVKREVMNKIPAVVHVNGTARPQIVQPHTNKVYHDLIKSFRSCTGIPILINTSFNVGNEPIVNTPDNAIRSFLESDLDILVMENIFVTKEDLTN